MGQPNEEEIRNKKNEDGDSLAEQKKIDNGVDIEPEADEWVAKPVGSIESDTTSNK
ncbi:hypothetical protein [Paenibacillus pinistramenti]|uniref:hypothetical protein n=1 Tax=Paenibacillus pinistramenti TaxID=1768003 RepID=UPI0019397145|nr:hypothetical protein [Paenibacillus pinistramenti]